MINKIKTIIFDYGGTLDTDGIHWSEKFWEAYLNFNVPVEKKDFRDAFVYSERKIVNIIRPEFNLKKTYETQLHYQMEYLKNINSLSEINLGLIEEMTMYTLKSVLKNIEYSKIVLSLLYKNYNLGLISNYYGNLETILTEVELKKYFKSVIDSAVAGVRKPDKKIFKLALEEMKADPDETIVVGDSYGNDIAPAKELGCSTMWLEGKGWSESIDTSRADIKIKSIKELPDIIKNL